MLLAGLVLGLAGGVPEPHLLIFAGGWAPEGHHASLERDVDQLLELLKPPAVLLFGRGDRRATVQTVAEVDPLHARLALIFGRSDGLGTTYRAPRRSGDGAARPEVFVEAVKSLARRPGGGIVFGAGHGRPSFEDHPATLELWGGAVDVRSLAEALDAPESRGPVTFVLGQCHSGAFSDLVHRSGNRAEALADPVRCVLAAAPPELEAAGCSPDAGEGGFIRYVAEALENGADYNGDGRTQLDEALAYARIHDPTIDVPVRSSELWLLGSGEEPDLRAVEWDLLRSQADHAEAAVLDALGARRAPREMVRELEASMARAQRLDAKLTAAEERWEAARRRVEDEVLARWPVLAHPFHPEARALLGAGVPGLDLWWARSPVSRELESADSARAKLADRRWNLERAIARPDRWLRVARAVVGRARARGEQLAGLERLRACEAREVPLRRRVRAGPRRPRPRR